MPTDITLRALETEDELETLHRLILRTFIGHEDVDRAFQPYHARMSAKCDLPDDGRRGIFVDHKLICACLVHARKLRIGHAYISTACIGAVLTHPEYRGRGLASRLIESVTDYAVDRGDALLLLDGISNFYDRFGFVSVHNWTQFTFQIDEILNGPTAQAHVRPATLHDVTAMHRQYERHFGAYTGAFARLPERQDFYLRYAAPYNAFFLAETDPGTVCGHMMRLQREPGWSSEVTADHPEGAVALLRHHATEARRHDRQADALHWLVPPQSELADWLADRYEVIVRTPVQPCGGWMARIANLDVLMHQMLPAWHAAWLAQNTTGQHGSLTLRIGQATHRLALDSSGVHLANGHDLEERAPDPNAQEAVLSPGVFTQLCFGYRSAHWAADQPDCTIPAALLPMLDALFPRRQSWIAGSDFF